MIGQNKIIHFQIQQITAVIFVFFGICAILVNVFSTEFTTKIKVFNIVSILVIGGVLSPTYFLNHKYVRLFQVIITLVIGVVTIFTEHETRIVSDYFITAGIILFFVYGFLPKFKITYIGVILILIFSTRFIAAIIQNKILPIPSIIINTTTSVALITFIQLAIQNQVNHYLQASSLNNTLFRLSLNMQAVLDELNLKLSTDQMHRILRNKKDYTIDEVFKELKNIYAFVRNVDDTARQYRMAILTNHIDVEMLIDLKDFIGAIIAVDKVTLNNPDSVEIIPPGNMEEEIVIKCLPYEIYMALQNIITYFVELIDRKGTVNNKLSVFCVKDTKNAVITIFSPNISLPYTPSSKELLVMPEPMWRRTMEERRMISLYEHISFYKGKISFHNFECGGAEVTITLPLYNPKADGEPECLKKAMSQGLI